MFYSIFSFFYKFRKQGFTLAEALIITVMTGACLLPILGTMQNAQVRTENFDHQSKMQQYARSRLTAEIANAAFDHKSVNLDDEYHYIVYFASSSSASAADEDDAKLIELPKTSATLEDLASFKSESDPNNWATSAVDLLGISRSKGAPYINVVHAYKTSVETKDTPALTEFGNEANIIESPKALLGIVVKTCLIKSNEDYYDPSDGAMVTAFNADGSIKTTDKSMPVTPVSLFSFVNLPTVSDEYIWMVASESKVIAFDPVSKSIANTITFGKGEQEPRHIAVHPSGKMLAVQCKNYIYLVNIDIKSLKKNEKKVLFGGSGDSYKYCEGPEEGGGIAFRPDGKVLYFTDLKNKKIHMYELNYTLADNSGRVLDWSETSPSVIPNDKCINFGSYGKKFTNLVAANDGYLYIGACLFDSGSEDDVKAVYKYPMYVSLKETKTILLADTGNELRNIDVSNDGRFILCVPKEKAGEDNKTIKIYDTNTGELIKSIQTSNKEINQGIFVSFSGNETDFKDGSLFIALSLKEKGAGGQAYILIYNFLDPLNPWAKLTYSQSTENGSLIASPVDAKIVFTSNLAPGAATPPAPAPGNNDEKLLFFANYVFKHVDYALNKDESVGLGGKNAFDIKRSGLAAKKRDILAVAEGEATRTIQLYDLNSLKKLEDEFFIASFTIASLTMNSQGTMLVSSHDDHGLGFYQYNFLDGTTKKSDIIGSYTRKIAFDGSIPDMALAFMYEKTGDSITAEYLYNLYNEDFAGRWETSDSDYYDRRNYQIPSGWKGLDIIGMPNGGFLALYGKTDGSSMLEWIGQKKWGDSANIGKYKLFARWTNIKHTSPVFFPTNNIDTFDYKVDGIDTLSGTVIMSKNPLSVSNAPSYVRIKTGYKNDGAIKWSSGDRYITPILLKPSGSQMYNYIGCAESIKLAPNKTYVDLPLKWKLNSGETFDDTCHIGFWNGSKTKGCNEGAVLFKIVDSPDHDYVSDCIKQDNTGTTYTSINDIDSKKIKEPTESLLLRQYAIQFYWEKQKEDSFPPLKSKRLALSPDCGTLAVLAIAEDGPRINLYDFNNQIYDQETQIEGLLLDYRKPKQSGVNSGSNTDLSKLENPWPEENIDKALFESVDDNCHFGDGINTFASATTKYDSWNSFNNNPCNYYLNSSDSGSDSLKYQKGIANKRFIGYYRPESDIKSMQMYFTDEPRIFYNKSFIYGTLERGDAAFIDNSIEINIKPLSSNLFQLDHASNKNMMCLSVFFNASSSPDISGVPTPVNSNIGERYYSLNDENIKKGWKPLSSLNTYILKNQPSFINSYLLNSDSGNINMNYAGMVFSRNRAKPVIYVKGINKLFVIYKNIIKAFTPGTGTNSRDIIISDDGQKLVFGKGDSLKVYNISNPTDEFFKNGENINGPASNYLGQIATISLNTNSKSFYLAVKPFSSYSSAEIGGEYTQLATGSFKISANAAAVASSGIYIVNNASNTVFVYNPLISSSDIEMKYNALIKKSNSAAVTAYNDTVYLFGNAGDGANDKIGGRVQSYDSATGEAMASLDSNGGYVTKESYQANISTDVEGWGNVVEVYSDSVDGSSYAAKYAFQSANFWQCGNNDEDSSYIYYKQKNNRSFTINCITVNNKDCTAALTDTGMKGYEIYGITSSGDSSSPLKTGTLNQNTVTTIDLGEKTFIGFKIKSKSTYDTSVVKHSALRELKFFRDNMVNLTPNDGGWTALGSGSSCSRVMPFGNVTVYNSSNNITNIFNNTGIDKFLTFNNSTKKCIGVKFNKKYVASVLRLGCTTDKDYISNFKIYGTNIASPNYSSPDSNWTEIKTYTGLGYCTGIIPYEFDMPSGNEDGFTSYLFSIDSIGHADGAGNEDGNDDASIYHFELWTHDLNQFGELAENNHMTPISTDALSEIKVGNGAACATPYGLVTTGGLTGSAATSTALLYWPHAINKYDGNYSQYGISRSLPNMKKARANHVLVWHKGKIYALGGREDSGNDHILGESNFVEVLDYNNKMEWKEYSIPYTYIGGARTDSLDKRYNFGACSFGDEIFIFGGVSDSSNVRSSAVAFNPEKGTIRKLTDMEDVLGKDKRLNPCVAVPYGSKIYIIGNDKDSPNLLKILEYTP